MTLNIAVIIKLEPDFSEGNVSYNPDGTLNRAETKSKLGAHSVIAVLAAFYAKVKHGAKIGVGTMGPPMSDIALKEAQLLCDADTLHLYSDRIFASADTLATAEVLKNGIKKMETDGNKVDIIFSGHRASDGETGQTGPQTAWKLGYPFFGNVIDYSIDEENHSIIVKRLVTIPGMDNIIEEIQAPMPVFIAIDPSYKHNFNTLSLRLQEAKYKKEANVRLKNFENFLKIFDHESLELEPKSVGLSGSPTIVHKVEKIPKGKVNRNTTIIEGKNYQDLEKVALKIIQVNNEMIKTK
ncbi:MAG: electron transfer flavoprotein subunit beta/FixA family protein [Nitrososphaeraceae archaeon]